MFANAKAVENFTRNADLVDLLEKHLITIFGPIVETLEECLQKSVARSWGIKLGVALVRAALGESAKDLGFPAPRGSAFARGEEKVMVIKAAWADHLEGAMPRSQGLKSALGYEEEEAEEEGKDEFTVSGTLEAPLEAPPENAWRNLLIQFPLVQDR